jgi:Fe2+ or Zn2+ uptake regulation protein
MIMTYGIFASETTIYRVLKQLNLLGINGSMVNDPASKEYKTKPKAVHHHFTGNYYLI